MCICGFSDRLSSSLEVWGMDEVIETGQVVLAAVSGNVSIVDFDGLLLGQIFNLVEHFGLLCEKVHHFRANLLDEVLTMGASSVLGHNANHVGCLQINAIVDDKRAIVLVLLNDALRWHTGQS